MKKLKDFILKYRAWVIGIFLLIVGISIGYLSHDGFKIVGNKSLPFFNKKTLPSSIIVDEIQAKKDSLASFYNEMVQAELNKDYEKTYELYKPALGIWVTKEEFIAFEAKRTEKVSVVSSSMTIHNITISENEGVVDRTRVICLSEKCEGKDKITDHGIRKFVYIDNQWSKMPDREPSERALKVASFYFANASDASIKQTIQNDSYGANNQSAALHFMALHYDDNPEELIFMEAGIEKYRAEQSRPVYNYQPPDITVQAPVVQSPVNNSLHCSSNKVGNYTYTNCY